MARILVLAVLLAAPLARAQDLNFGALDDGANVATVTIGAENALVVGAGYAHVATLADRRLVLGGDVTLGGAELDANDFQLRAGALVPIVEHGRWKLVGGLAGTVRGTKNAIARMIGVGTDVVLHAGYYAPHWFAGIEGGFDWELATQISPNDAYRMQVYADAREGWYGMPGGLLRAGVEGGATFGGNDLILRVGRVTDIAGDPALFPFYATVAYDRRW